MLKWQVIPEVLGQGMRAIRGILPSSFSRTERVYYMSYRKDYSSCFTSMEVCITMVWEIFCASIVQDLTRNNDVMPSK